MTSVPVVVHVFHPPPEGVPIAAKLDHLVNEFKALSSPRDSSSASEGGVAKGGVACNDDRMYFMAASQALRRVTNEVVKKEELAHKNNVDTMLKLDDLETALATGREERKKSSQELKHSEKERIKALERARATDEKMKTVTEQAEKDRVELAKEKKKVQQLQRKVDEFQRQQRMSPRDDSSDGEKKKGKESNSNTDVAGLQRGLEKVKSQLKKKQDEYQNQAVNLQQAISKIKNLEAKMNEDKGVVDHLKRQIEHLEVRIEEDHAQANSEYLSQEMETAKAIQRIKSDFESREKDYKAEIAAFTRASKQNTDKFRRAEERANRLQGKLVELQNTPVDYTPYGDADIADRIRIRNLVDQTQERLATLVGLKPAPGESLSLCWRLALGPSTEDHVRILRAQELIADADPSLFTEHDRTFVEDEAALRHACKLYSRLRSPGNDLHRPFTRDGYNSSVQRYLRFSPTEKAGESLVSMVNYVCSPSIRPPSR